MNSLFAFYLGAPDDQGRYLCDIWEWPDSKWEEVHDYIQWIFPNVEKSQFNLSAPVLDVETIEAWRSSIGMQKLVLKSVERYLEFLKRNTDIWVDVVDHNHLRITRMLKCMMVLGLEDDAVRVFNWLDTVANSSNISPSSVSYWRNAILRK